MSVVRRRAGMVYARGHVPCSGRAEWAGVGRRLVAGGLLFGGRAELIALAASGSDFSKLMADPGAVFGGSRGVCRLGWCRLPLAGVRRWCTSPFALRVALLLDGFCVLIGDALPLSLVSASFPFCLRLWGAFVSLIYGFSEGKVDKCSLSGSGSCHQVTFFCSGHQVTFDFFAAFQ